MELDSHIILSLISYKITSLLVGCVFAYMSYRLVMSRIFRGDSGRGRHGYAGEGDSLGYR